MSKIILFISAFVPMYILFLINLVIEIICGNLTFNITNTCVLIGLCVLILIGTLGILLLVNCNNKTSKQVKVIKKKNLTDQHFLNYFSLFVLLALTFDLSKICFIGVFIVILIFIGVVYIKNNIYYVNPLLNILGYSFYDITYLDTDNKEKEIRIFFKGELICDNPNYELFQMHKNLQFLKVKENK